jgi:hypothetical protein
MPHALTPSVISPTAQWLKCMNCAAFRSGEIVHSRTAFLQGLRQSGWIDGGNIRIDYRWGAGDADNMRKYAAGLVTLAPDGREAALDPQNHA